MVIGVAALLLSSCGLYQKYESKADVPADVYGTNVSNTANSAAEMSWRDFFTDPQLQALIDSAIINNTDLHASRIAVEKSQIALKTAKLAYLPSLYFNPSGSLSSFDNSPVSKSYNLPLQIDWQPDIFAGLTNQKRKAEVLLEQTKYMEEAMRANIISTVAQLYSRLQIYDRQLDILLTTEKLWAESLETQKVLMENGKAYSTAVNQMEASYLNVKTQIVDIKNDIRHTELSLCRLLAISPRHISRGEWGSYQLPQNIGVGVPSQMLSLRSDVKVAERAMAAAYYNVNDARSAFFPSISLSGAAGWTNNAGIVSDPGKLLWNVVASLSQPIFARGKLRANLKINELTQEEVAKKYVQTIINAGNEVNEAIADCNASLEKDQLYKRQVSVLKDAFDGTHELMNNGKANYLEVLTAQEALLQAQLAEAMNLYNGSISTIALYIALGGATK